jgi:hypothetical protein
MAELQVCRWKSVDIVSATGTHFPFNTLVTGMEQIDLPEGQIIMR